jgi:hypothetical protein
MRSVLVCKLRLHLGELVELCLVFLVFLEVEPTVLDRERSETCAEVVACSTLPESGEDGTERSALDTADMQSPLLSRPPLLLPWSWLVDTVLAKSQNFLWSWEAQT